MKTETALKENELAVAVALNPFGFGGVCEFKLNLEDKQDVMRNIEGIVEAAKTPLFQRIGLLSKENETLKKRALSNEEIERFAILLKTHSNEFRADGRPTNDDLLVAKLQSMLKK